MNRKLAVLLFIGVILGVLVGTAVTNRGIDGIQWGPTIMGGVFGYALVVFVVRKRNRKKT